MAAPLPRLPWASRRATSLTNGIRFGVPSACDKRLLKFRAGALHNVSPLRRFLLDQSRELLGRPAGGVVANLLVARFEEIRLDCAVDGGVELIDNRARRAGWRRDAEPYRGFITGNAGLSDRRQLGEAGRTLRAGDGQRPDTLLPGMRRDGREALEH